jgi:hypothetical protein
MEPEIIIPSTGYSPYSFGAAIAASGDELLVGAPYRYYTSRAFYGETIPPPAAFLLRRAGDGWHREKVLTPTDPALAEGFACSLALGESFAIVGAPGYENGDGPIFDFARASQAELVLRATLDSPERQNDHSDVFSQYGNSVAADARTVIIGAPLDSRRCEGGGAVYVFDRNDPSQQPIAILEGTRPDEGFGTAVALSGDLLIVGAAAHFSNEQLTGAAYLYVREAPNRWREIARVAGEHAGEAFGAHVAIDGQRFVVCAPGNGASATPVGSGRVQLFEARSDGCVETARIVETPGFGLAVALRGDRLAIGQPMFTAPGGARQTGRVGLYRLAPGGPQHEHWLTVSKAAEHARVGSSIALGPDYVAAGAPGLGEEDDGAGFVTIANW